jgi:hypothetical protein
MLGKHSSTQRKYALCVGTVAKLQPLWYAGSWVPAVTQTSAGHAQLPPRSGAQASCSSNHSSSNAPSRVIQQTALRVLAAAGIGKDIAFP